MQDWLTNDQNIDPFDPAGPLDVDEVADHFQHYWQLHFKTETRRQPADDKNKNNKRGRDNGNQSSSHGAQNDNKKAKKDQGSKGGSVATNNGPGGREGDHGRCPIQGHDGMRHDWRGCHLNPFSRRFDAKAG